MHIYDCWDTKSWALKLCTDVVLTILKVDLNSSHIPFGGTTSIIPVPYNSLLRFIEFGLIPFPTSVCNPSISQSMPPFFFKNSTSSANCCLWSHLSTMGNSSSLFI